MGEGAQEHLLSSHEAAAHCGAVHGQGEQSGENGKNWLRGGIYERGGSGARGFWWYHEITAAAPHANSRESARDKRDNNSNFLFPFPRGRAESSMRRGCSPW